MISSISSAPHLQVRDLAENRIPRTPDSFPGNRQRVVLVTPAFFPTRLASDPSLSARVHIPSLILQLRLALQTDSPVACSGLTISLQVLQLYFQVPVTGRAFFFPLSSSRFAFCALPHSNSGYQSFLPVV